jgi:hypothetical protein
VFGYYSGRSERLERIFDAPQRRYYDSAIKPGAEETFDPRRSELRRLFYVRESSRHVPLSMSSANDEKLSSCNGRRDWD